MNIDLFDYDLPKELIAQEPAKERGTDRLLIANGPGGLRHAHFPDVVDLIGPDDLLVLNNTKVIPSRIHLVKKGSGGKVQLLFIEPADGRSVEESSLWKCIYGAGKPLRPDQILEGEAGELKVVSNLGGGIAEVTTLDDKPILPILLAYGAMPLPPYINRPADANDSDRYQTVYAKEQGAVAAPTAGLHFTDALLDKIRAKGTRIEQLTLHVGLGTFLPIREDAFADITKHKMHSERYSVSAELSAAVAACHARGGKVWAVGTTVVRALESAATDDYVVPATSSQTEIFIYPGYHFKVVDALITNFHLPKSTLIMLVSAFAGREETLAAYAQAVKEGYHFFSYGDASVFYRKEER